MTPSKASNSLWAIVVILLLSGASGFSFSPLPTTRQSISSPYIPSQSFRGRVAGFVVGQHCTTGTHLFASNDGKSESESKSTKDPVELTPERIAELVEVSFVNGVMQLAQGYVDVLKLFIAAVQSGYSMGLSPPKLLGALSQCPIESANRPLMDEEVQLRTTWVQVVYLVLDQVRYQDKSLEDFEQEENMIEDSIRETYQSAIPILLQAKASEETFEAEKMLQLAIPSATTASMDPMEKAIVSQSIRVIWLTLIVLEEEEQCIEDKKPFRPRPQIPGAYDD